MKLKYLFRADWILPALKVSLIVGSVLFAINHGRAVYEHTMNAGRWLSVVLSYVVPYCVFIIGKASNMKANSTPEDRTGDR